MLQNVKLHIFLLDYPTWALTRVSFHSPVCVLIIDDEQDLGLAYDRFRRLTAS